MGAPLAARAEPPKKEDKTAMVKTLGVKTLDFSEFIASSVWDEVDEVLRGIYKEVSEVLGKEFPYPGVK